MSFQQIEGTEHPVTQQRPEPWNLGIVQGDWEIWPESPCATCSVWPLTHFSKHSGPQRPLCEMQRTSVSRGFREHAERGYL